MGVTLDFSTAVPIDQAQAPQPTQPVKLDMSTAIPLPQKSTKGFFESLEDPAGTLKDLNDRTMKTLSEGVRPEDANKQKAFMTGVARSFPGSDISSALVEQGINKAQGLMGVPAQGDPTRDRTFMQSYDAAQKRGQQDEALNPTASTMGKVVGSLPQYAVGSEMYGPTTGLADKMLRGATLNAGIGQGQRGLKGDLKATAIDAATGAGGEALMAGVSKGAQAISDLAPSVPARLLGLAKRIPVIGGLVDASQQLAEKKAAEATAERLADATQAISDLPKSDIITSGDNLTKAAQSAFKKINDNYQEVVAPISSKYGHMTADPSSLINEINGIMSERGVMDTNGKVLTDEIKNYPKESTGKMLSDLSDLRSKLIGVSDVSPKGSVVTRSELPQTTTSYDPLTGAATTTQIAPSSQGGSQLVQGNGVSYDPATGQRIVKNNPLNISKLGNIVKQLQESANFGSGIRSPEEALYAKLSYAGKDALHNSLSNVASPEELKNLVTAKQIYSSTRPIVEDLVSATSNKFPEQIVRSAGSQLPPSLAKDVMAKAPQAQPAVGDVILNHLVSKASTPKAFTKAIDTYGRDTLQNLLGDETFSSLEQAEKQFSTAKIGIKKPDGVLLKIIQKTFNPASYPSSLKNLSGAVAPQISDQLSQ